jgi:hypothetical protein
VHDSLSECNQVVRLTQGRLELTTTYVEQAVMRLSLEIQQPPERLRRTLAVWLDDLDQIHGGTMILAPRPASQNLATRSVGRSDPGKDDERGGLTRILDVVAFSGDQFGDVYELVCMAQAPRCVGA